MLVDGGGEIHTGRSHNSPSDPDLIDSQADEDDLVRMTWKEVT